MFEMLMQASTCRQLQYSAISIISIPSTSSIMALRGVLWDTTAFPFTNSMVYEVFQLCGRQGKAFGDYLWCHPGSFGKAAIHDVDWKILNSVPHWPGLV